MNGKQFVKGMAVVGGLVGYSYVVHKVSFWAGRFVGWFDAAKIIVETAKDMEKEKEEKSDRTSYSRYAKSE